MGALRHLPAQALTAGALAAGALSPTPAAAAPQTGRSLTITATPTELPFGHATTVRGTLLQATAPVAGEAVELQASAYPVRGFRDVGHTTTAADGTFSFPPVRPNRNTRYRVVDLGSGVVGKTREVFVDAPAVQHVYRLRTGQAMVTVISNHARDVNWGQRPVHWFAARRGSRTFTLVATTRTRELRPGVTYMTATFYAPAPRFSYRVCFKPPLVQGVGPPPHKACPTRSFVLPSPRHGKPALEYHGEGRGFPNIPAYPSTAQIAAATRFLAGRAGHTAFAVIDTHGGVWGLRVHERFISASVVKAMLLVAFLQRLDHLHQELDDASRALLFPMIHASDNDTASAVQAIVGNAALLSLAGQARMTDFGVSADWIYTQISAADQARFFYLQDSLTPPRFRAYARYLLSTIEPDQSWGVPAVARPHWRVFFKGGWLPRSIGLVNQVARLERPGGTFAVAVLTDGDPSMPYGEETIAGVAARLLGRAG
jgi:hypothetical protein